MADLTDRLRAVLEREIVSQTNVSAIAQALILCAVPTFSECPVAERPELCRRANFKRSVQNAIISSLLNNIRTQFDSGKVDFPRRASGVTVPCLLVQVSSVALYSLPVTSDNTGLSPIVTFRLHLPLPRGGWFLALPQASSALFQFCLYECCPSC